MNPSEYGEMYKLESFYWWFVARRQLLDVLAKEASSEFNQPLILDVGCGTGINYSVLSKYGATVATDFAKEALEFSQARGIADLVRSRVETLPFNSASFDIITALDMLEHIDDDLRAMEELRRILKHDGLLIITVPAYGFLWSEHDEALHHRRRYAASELRNKLTRAGFDVERISYYITFLFFPILIMRFFQSIFKRSVQPKTSHIILPRWVNSLLIGILAIERFILKRMNFPFGVSLVCLATRRGDRDASAPIQPVLPAEAPNQSVPRYPA